MRFAKFPIEIKQIQDCVNHRPRCWNENSFFCVSTSIAGIYHYHLQILKDSLVSKKYLNFLKQAAWYAVTWVWRLFNYYWHPWGFSWPGNTKIRSHFNILCLGIDIYVARKFKSDLSAENLQADWSSSPDQARLLRKRKLILHIFRIKWWNQMK